MASDNPMASLAEAVENSELILACISSEYSSSSFCRFELEYALRLHRKIVLIRVQQKYRPDGWLDFMCGHRRIHDFTKGDFNDNYGLLKTRINEYLMQK